MDDVEQENLDRVGERHWFYRGKRRIARHWIRRSLEPGPEDMLVDVGCGAGHFLAEWPHGRKAGVDASARAVAIARGRTPTVIHSESARLPFKDGEAAVVTALDVLEHIQNDRAALAEMVRVLAPGGVLFLTVPALPALWSDWDVSLGHHRRYTRRSLRALTPPELTVLRLSYFNEWSLLPVLLVRGWRRLFGRGGGGRLEDRVPPEPLNGWLENIFVWSACRRFYAPPLGTSLMCLLRKPGAPGGINRSGSAPRPPV